MWTYRIAGTSLLRDESWLTNCEGLGELVEYFQKNTKTSSDRLFATCSLQTRQKTHQGIFFPRGSFRTRRGTLPLMFDWRQCVGSVLGFDSAPKQSQLHELLACLPACLLACLFACCLWLSNALDNRRSDEELLKSRRRPKNCRWMCRHPTADCWLVVSLSCLSPGLEGSHRPNGQWDLQHFFASFEDLGFVERNKCF